MAGRKSDFTLPTNTLDDLFSTQEERDDAKLAKIRDIPLTEIDNFPDHPFKVRDDEDMLQLVESVKERGVITPATVRQKEDGRYELVSGHRRKRACELAGFETLRCEVVDLDRDAATILMVESNYQRSQILPSEKAFAYKMRLEAMSRQGKRTDLTSDPVGPKLSGERSNIELSSETGDSTSQIKRYIRLTSLVPELLDLVDEGKIKMRPAVELSYLDEDSQRAVVDNQTANDVTEQVMKGNIAIIKHTDNGETQIETPESGAEFAVYLKAAGSYEVAEDTERDYLTCDENGFAQTKDMPYGIYTVHQVSGWEGSKLMPDFDVFISQNGATYRYLINNAPFNSFIKIVKQDAETGKTIPYAGAGFKIYDPDGNPVTMTFTYPTPTTIDVFYTNAEGSLVTPEKLPFGKGYSIVEVQAPYGYVLDETPVYFDVTEDNSTEESGVTVVKVDKPNMAQKGTITVEKTGEVFFGVSVIGGVDESGNELPTIL